MRRRIFGLFVGDRMTRVFNIAMLCILAGIYYSQHGGFEQSSSANAATTDRQQVVKPAVAPVSEPIALTAPVVTAALTTETDAEPAQALIQPKTYPAMSETEIDAAKKRFTAQALTNSTVIRQVALDQPVATQRETPENLMTVSGSVVNARAEPTTQSQVLAKLKRGAEVMATGEQEGSWRQVVVVESGEVVWMHRKFLKAAS